MKALSLWEPWASLMMVGAKKIETRSWPTKYRGPLLICAARGGLPLFQTRLILRGLHPFEKPLRILTKGEDRPVSVVDLNHGKALCIVDLVDCIPTNGMETPGVTSDEYAFGDYLPGRFAWVTTNLRPIKNPFEINGRQRIFNVPDELIEAAERE